MKKHGSPIPFTIFLLSIFHFGTASCKIFTNPLRADGFGGQYQTIICSIIYAELTGNTFMYTPFRNVEHNYDGDPEFLKNKEWLVNLIDHYPINNDINLQKKRSGGEYITFFESHLNESIKSDSLKKIKDLFRANKNRDDYYDKDKINIAIHIRRRNPHDLYDLGTSVPDAVYVKLISELRQKYLSKPYVFHIISQGNMDSFRDKFPGDDIVLHINESLEDSFTSMVLADVLVTATSSLSYTAGLLSEGEIYYLRFWHLPLPHWHVIETGVKRE